MKIYYRYLIIEHDDFIMEPSKLAWLPDEGELDMKKRKKIVLILLLFFALLILCTILFFWKALRSAVSVRKLEDGLYTMSYSGNYALDDFLAHGGASSDMEVADFVVQNAFHGLIDLNLQSRPYGCSTLAVEGPQSSRLFGRNFDWGNCTALIVETAPTDGYASVSTVNMDFLNLGLSLSEGAFVRLMSVAAPYAPMDGMNEKGLCVAVLMIEDRPGFDQQSEKSDLTTTTVVRLLLDKAATVEEAVELLETYDLHASAGMMVHFAIADASGRSVVVEYIDNAMNVVETPVVTNFYLTEEEKYGVGTAESMKRYQILTEQMEGRDAWDMDAVRDALDSVSKHNFDSPFASTEWSVVYDQTNGEARYYHREDYSHFFPFSVR